MSEILCPFWLKCSPVDLLLLLFCAYPLCSLNLSWRVRSLSPMYCTLHLSYWIQYKIFLDWQFTGLFMSMENFEAVDFTVFPSMIKGHIGQFLHFVIPTMFLLVLCSVGGTFARISLSLILGGLLYATRGGRGKASLRWGSFSTMVLQCFFIIEGKPGSLGSYITAKTGLFTVFSVIVLTLSSACFLGISFAFLIAELMILIL